MASEPTDLIREADAALAQEAANEGGPIVDDPADLVRRLRDALAAAHGDIQVIADYAGTDADTLDILRCIRELAADRRALAEVNATIQRVKDVLDRSSRLVHLDFIRRAIEGEQS